MRHGNEPTRYTVVATVVLAQLLLFVLYGKPQLGDGYLEGQWALDYAGGFVRRGMFGAVLSTIVPAGLFLSVAKVAFYGVAVTCLVVSCRTYVKLVQRAGAPSQPYAIVNVLVFGLMAVNPFFWSFYAESLGRFEGIFFLVAAGTIAWLRRAPRTASLFLVLTAPFLGAVHEVYLILYFPLLLSLIGSSGLPKALARRFLLVGVLVAGLSLGLFYALPKWIHFDASSAQAAIDSKLPEMPHAGSALYNSHQQVARVPLLKGSMRHAAHYALEFAVTTLFFCVGALLTAGPLPRSLFARPWAKGAVGAALVGGVAYVALSVIAIDWGRFCMDLIMLAMLLIHARHSDDALPQQPGELVCDWFGPRLLYVVTAAVIFAVSTNLPLTKIPLGRDASATATISGLVGSPEPLNSRRWSRVRHG